ncbi:hypothetical protein BHOIPH791_09400 [Bartonella henselae]|nr:hypothetical protein BhenCHDE101_07505 [Bartonella henselae]PNM38995.1 hypothetical protein AL470_006815 [Bartonella henselae str. Houston-1]OLL40667.1 hypothetical protein AT237_06190 [Bartonella henselae]OLL46435.1 hypothetical protein AT242_07225 [Bartonella henselae]OLL59394.1 hypothetical protein AT248_04965 [Bartonella henselae]
MTSRNAGEGNNEEFFISFVCVVCRAMIFALSLRRCIHESKVAFCCSDGGVIIAVYNTIITCSKFYSKMVRELKKVIKPCLRALERFLKMEQL